MVDTHCHLDACGSNPQQVIDRAVERGVSRIATVGTNPTSIDHALELARLRREVAAIVGRHPHETAGFCDRDIEPIERASRSPEVCAIGETGLDYYRDHAPRADQRRAFSLHIDLAARTGLALVIHNRAADSDIFAMLAERADELRVVLHCFSALGRLEECVERRYFCSFAGNVTYPRAQDLQEAAAQLPEELLLVETDAPYLAPQPVRGKPNEPKNVVDTAAYVAALRGVDYAQLEETVQRNAAFVFGW